MNIQNYIGIAALAILSCPLSAAENTSANISHLELEEVIVTASPHQKSAQEIAGSFNLLANEDLRREAAATLGETLQNEVGISSSSFGSGVGSPMIRGLGGKRVEILQNSTTVGDASDISADHAVASEALLAERIEILRGPATLRYGPGAIGGVINVIDNRIHTVPFEGVEGALEARYSSNGHARATVGRFDAGFSGFNLHLDAVTRDSNNVSIPGSALSANALEDMDDADGASGTMENSDSEADSFSAGLSWVGEDSVIGFSYSKLDNNYGLPPNSHSHEEHGEHDEDHEGDEHLEESEEFVRIDMQQETYQTKLLFTDLGNFLGQLDVDYAYTDYQHTELEFEPDSGEVMIGSIIESVSHNLRAELTHNQYMGWRGAWGLQVSDRDFGASGEEAFIPPSETFSRGVYWLEEAELALGNLELGLRFDQQEITLSGQEFDHSTVNAGASWFVPINQQQRLSLVLSHSERAPAAEELLSNGLHIATSSFEIGQRHLDTESANSLEITWVYRDTDNSQFNARVSAYHNQFQRFIYLQDSGLALSHDLEEEGLQGIDACSADLADFDGSAEELAESVGCFTYQQRDASFSGIELETSWSLSDTQRIELQGDLVRGRFDQGANKDIPRLPPATVRASWIYQDDSWRAAINLTHAASQTRAGLNESVTDSYNRLDASLSYQQESWFVFLKGQKLTDENIRNATSLLRDIAPEAGRNLTVGVRYRF
jgi:iron complex outermembrane receptor protein